jgi:hypothetical protein
MPAAQARATVTHFESALAALLSMLSRMFDQQWSRHMDHQAGRCGDSESAIQI